MPDQQPLSLISHQKRSVLEIQHPLLRFSISAAVILGIWQFCTWLFEVPSFILPSPVEVLYKISTRYEVLLSHAWVTVQEILMGLALGLVMGMLFALLILWFRPLKLWLLPILIASQAIPVFAIGPALMLWFGYGMASKVVMAAIIIFFPITVCCYDGLRNTPSGYLDLAKTLGASRWQRFLHIQLPAALPTIGSGVRVAVVIAPIGAVVGEWVGSSEGLGYLMLQANARMLVDEMFAALFILALISVGLYYGTDAVLRKTISWEAN